ncbi:MAG TPA: hypothetical protein VNM24_00915 [Burkholderiales bacterium]|nr:hypothetical protein [Burkholderiales bacterium]
MKTKKLVASALGAILLTGSTLALAGDWKSRSVERWDERPRHERSWSDHGRHDWERDYRNPRGHGYYRGRGHWKPYWHHHYRHHHHHFHHHHYGYWRPYGYDSDGVTIIFRGTFH